MQRKISIYEAISINVIPANTKVFYHGWILQMDKGYKDRANCVYPLFPSDLPVEKMVNYCEILYQSNNLIPLFKLTKSSHPPDLDFYLESKGYIQYNETSFQTIELLNYNVKQLSTDFHISNKLNKSWFWAYSNWNAISKKKQNIVKDIWKRVSVKLYFCYLMHQDQCVCIGFIMQMDDICGIFGVTTDPEKRRKGYGYELMRNLLSFAANNGIKTCFLQVEVSNHPALALYDALGFKEQYRYWYRKKQE